MKKISILMEQLEEEAKKRAKSHIENLFQNPGQLEKLDQLKHTYLRKKFSTESKLKCAMQTQLDGARDGLTHLTTSLKEIDEVDANLRAMNNTFKKLPNYTEKLLDIREEDMRHSQYVIAKENLKYIFNVPENVEKTKSLIADGNLLQAHQCLRELENSRDELLLELHRLPNQSMLDIGILKAYFADVEELSELMEKQIRLILSRTLNVVRKDPSVIVSVLRIIEREEAEDRKEICVKSGFKPPGRPKEWKKMAYDILKKTVSIQIQSKQLVEREDNKLWLVRFLELVRQLILEDLRVVKSLCVPCFPPAYDVFQWYVSWYHEALSIHLQELIDDGLEGNEYFSLLSWVLNTYKSEELMGHPALKDYTASFEPLLPDKIIDKLQEEYLNLMESNYKQWLHNTLKQEKEEWYSNMPPQPITSTPVIIFKMISENLDVAKKINQDLAYKALNLSLNQVIKYEIYYKRAIVEYKNKHFEDRSKNIYFTQYMIMIINNCHQIIELGGQLFLLYGTSETPEVLNSTFKILSERYMKLRDESSKYLLEEPFLDLDKHLSELFTTKWMTTYLAIETICATLEDYFVDYKNLVESNYTHVILKARYAIVQRYLIPMLSRKISFKTSDEAKSMSEKITKEIRQLKRVFQEAGSAEDDDCLDVIISLADLLNSDEEMLILDMHKIVDKNPDLSEDHLLRLLHLRGDFTKGIVKDRVTFVIENKKDGKSRHNLFKNLIFPKLVTLGF